MKSYYLPFADEGRVTWLNNFAQKIPAHAAVLEISTAQITSVQNDAAMFAYAVNLVNSFKTGLSQRVGFKDILKNGPEGTPLEIPTFQQPDPPAPVPSGIFVRIRRLVNNIKSNDNYNEAIGNDLGIIGAEQDEATLEMKPALKIKIEAGKPIIIWKKGKADSLDIYVDRGDGKSFVYLANDSSPDFIDNTPLPDNVNMAEWKYKAIYRINDDQVGEFSDPVSTVVKREVG